MGTGICYSDVVLLVMGADRTQLNRAREVIQGLTASVPAHVADGFSRFVQAVPGERLERLMRSPARRPLLEAIFRQMPRHVDRDQASGMSSAIRWCITGRRDGAEDIYQLDFKDGGCFLRRGPSGPDPQLTITLDGADFLRVAAGTLDPMQAYFKGQIKLAGDVMLGAKMASLFRIPGGRRTSSQATRQ